MRLSFVVFSYVSSSGGPAAPARSCGLIFSTLNLAARSRIVLSTSSSGGGSPLIQRSGLMRATTNERRYGLARPRSFSFFTAAATFSCAAVHLQGQARLLHVGERL